MIAPASTPEITPANLVLGQWARYTPCAGTFTRSLDHHHAKERNLQILAIHEGDGFLSHQQSNHILCPGHLYLIASTQTPCAFNAKNIKASLFTFSQKLIESTQANRALPMPLFMDCYSCVNRSSSLLGSSRLTPKTTALIKDFQTAQDPNYAQQTQLLGKSIEILGLTLSLIEEKNKKTKPFICCKEDISRVNQAAQFVEEHLESSLTLDQIAKASRLNEFKLKAGFRQCYGATVFGYLREKRMQLAHRLFSSGEHNVTQVAMRVGYNNPSHFAAAFRNAYSINPKAYIQSLRSLPPQSL